MTLLDHVTSPDEGRKILPKIRNFSTIIGLCAQNVWSEIMFPEFENINSQNQ